jgi:hypothetical protein
MTARSKLAQQIIAALRREVRMWRKLYSHYPSSSKMKRSMQSTDNLGALTRKMKRSEHTNPPENL